MSVVLVTGGAGFVGANLVRRLREHAHVVVLDKLTYAGSRAAVEGLDGVSLVVGDVVDRETVRAALSRYRPQAVIHLAAESHVDRSIDASGDFVRTNVLGTWSLLEETRRYLDHGAPAEFRLVHVSTDEVFGELGETGAFDAESPYRPSSPYSASKAGGDHLVTAWHRTWGLPVVLTHATNNYGPWQHREKLVPNTIARALRGEPVPVYGTGRNVRDWLFVDDHCDALERVLAQGRIGARYLIGARCERRNLELVQQVCALLDRLRPRASSYLEQIALVPDRPGHDWRYAVDPSRIEEELGWRPRRTLDDALRETVEWYLASPGWLDPQVASERGRER